MILEVVSSERAQKILSTTPLLVRFLAYTPLNIMKEINIFFVFRKHYLKILRRTMVTY